MERSGGGGELQESVLGSVEDIQVIVTFTVVVLIILAGVVHGEDRDLHVRLLLRLTEGVYVVDWRR